MEDNVLTMDELKLRCRYKIVAQSMADEDVSMVLCYAQAVDDAEIIVDALRLAYGDSSLKFYWLLCDAFNEIMDVSRVEQGLFREFFERMDDFPKESSYEVLSMVAAGVPADGLSFERRAALAARWNRELAESKWFLELPDAEQSFVRKLEVRYQNILGLIVP